MEVEELYRMPKWAGIYYFKNTLNGKYYIGQAVMLRKRLLHHLSNFNAQRYDAPLYKAWAKYTLEPFEVGILEEFKSGYTKEELKAKLDEREIFYIEKFNSYGATGYNQTKGGDAGVLGLKMTEDQKKHISENSKEMNSDGRNLIYVYDIKDKLYYTFITAEYAAKYLNINVHTLRNHRNKIKNKRFISARTPEELQLKKEEFFRKKNINSEI